MYLYAAIVILHQFIKSTKGFAVFESTECLNETRI